MKEWYEQTIVGPCREVKKNHGKERDPRWNKIRKVQIQRYPSCAVCGKKHSLHVHHVIPFHVRPDLELDFNNLLTLCSRCHFMFGHLNYWQAWNPTVRRDAVSWEQKIRTRPTKRVIKKRG